MRLERKKKRLEWLRGLLAQAMDQSGIKKLPRPTATVSLGQLKGKAIIVEESEIPTDYWRRPEPVPDKTALTAALRARADAIDEAAKLQGEEREAAMKQVDILHPPIPGVTLSNGGICVTIRNK